MGEPIKVLLVDDDEDEYILTQDLLSDRSYRTDLSEPVGFELAWVATFEAALDEIEKQDFDVYLVDYHLGERNGLELVNIAGTMGCRKPIILMTGQGSYDVDLEAMKAGATDYLVKGEVTAALLERSIRYAIERKRAEEKIRKNAERAELLAALSQTFAEAGLHFAEVLKTIAHRIAESTGDACIIRLLSEDAQWLDPVAFYHPDPKILAVLQDSPASSRLSVKAEPHGKVLQNGHPQLITGDSKLFSLISDTISRSGQAGRFTPLSNLIIPLRVKDRPIGTLGVLRVQNRSPFVLDDELFYLDLGNRAALAIENARLYDVEAQRVRELDALHRATSALLSTIDLDTLLSRILDIAQSAVPAADKALLHLDITKDGENQHRENSGNQDPRIKKVQYPRSELCTAAALQDRFPMLIPDTREKLDLSRSCFAKTGLPIDLDRSRSAVIAPLILGEELFGLISLSAAHPLAFTEADKRLLMSFANTTTAALHNAMLHAEVQKLAVTDSLTEIFNRRGLFGFGRREIERAMRFGRSLTVILIDIDNFKDINDSYGHGVGDQVLRIVADRLKASVREVDILGRYGGDEFVILLPETDGPAAAAAAERIRFHLAEPIAIKGPAPALEGARSFLSITASLGLASLAGQPQDLTSLLARADVAAYAAKQRGRNRIEAG